MHLYTNIKYFYLTKESKCRSLPNELHIENDNSVFIMVRVYKRASF